MENSNIVLNMPKNMNKDASISIFDKVTRSLNKYNQFQINFWIHKSYEPFYDELDTIFDSYKIKKYEITPGFIVNLSRHAHIVKTITDILKEEEEIRNLASVGMTDNHEAALGGRIFCTHLTAHQIFCQKYASGVYKNFMLNLDRSIGCHRELFGINGSLKNDYQEICRSVDHIISKIH